MPNLTPLKSIVRELGDYLKAEMPSLADVLEDFPSANEEMQLPALSIFSGQPKYASELAPYLFTAIPTADVNHKAPVKLVVGQYDFEMQIDIWCGTKEERFKLYDEFFAAINKLQIPMGLSLVLVDYHNTVARYDISGHRFDDSEAGSQRAEWRVKVDLLATCKAIMERDEFIITEPIENNLETTNTNIDC